MKKNILSKSIIMLYCMIVVANYGCNSQQTNHEESDSIAAGETQPEVTVNEDENVRNFVSEVYSKVVKYNNDEYDGNGNVDISDYLLNYCDKDIQNLVHTFKKAEKYIDEHNLYDEDNASIFGGDGNHEISYYFINGDDENFASWDEIVKIMKWDIDNVTVDGDKASVVIKLRLMSCYEGHQIHLFISHLELVKEDGEWRFSDFNNYLREMRPVVELLAGYLPNAKKTASTVTAQNTSKMVYANDEDGWVNVRSSNNSSSEILGRLYNDDAPVELISIVGNWYKVKYQGRVGYIHKDHAYIEKE